ncbi:hypothetical protein BDV12DRAFT_191720 [Aspergillus spectabilis]
MPHPSINLEPYREEISNLYQTGTFPGTIIELLANRYGIQVGLRTLKARLTMWGITKQNRTAATDQVLHARIKVLMYQVGLEEHEILHILQAEGFNIQARTLKYVRHRLGLLRHTTNTIADQAEVERVLTQLRTELSNGQIEGYSRRMLYHHFRNQGFLISRYLAPYGIEIYGAIDAYSRYIIWIYVGISSRTAVSVLRQFLDTLEVTQQQPRFVRSDRGTETILLAEAQHKLQQSLHPEILITDCYLYGTSTANQRIEAWWLQLTRGILFRYRAYFRGLLEEGKYSKDNINDQIAIYVIYMPLLRIQVTSFVRTWNSHKIRRQRNRPHLVHGKPFMNYNFPPTGVQNHGIQFNQELFKSLQEDVQEWDANEYLPAETYNWTLAQLLELGFDPRNLPEIAGDHVFIPFRTIYLELRSRIQAHLQQGSRPYLSLSVRPAGAFDWDPQLNPEGVEEIEVEYDQEDGDELHN